MQLLELMEELIEMMKNCSQKDIVIMDFTKSFDKVYHSLLLLKLHHYGVRGQVNEWINGFLQNHWQAVVVDRIISDIVRVKSSVPLSSFLDPSLFFTYINNLPENLSSQTQLFRDNTGIYSR